MNVEERMAATMAAYRAHVERQDREAPDWDPIPAKPCECPPRQSYAETPVEGWRPLGLVAQR